MEFVNFVNYKVYMDNSNNKNTHNNQSYSSKKDDYNQNSQSGIYLRDDHCDWGSSGMQDLVETHNDSN